PAVAPTARGPADVFAAGRWAGVARRVSMGANDRLLMALAQPSAVSIPRAMFFLPCGIPRRVIAKSLENRACRYRPVRRRRRKERHCGFVPPRNHIARPEDSVPEQSDYGSRPGALPTKRDAPPGQVVGTR